MPTSPAAIWQGMQHRWEYNHRINRFGSYIRPSSVGPVAGHTAASGTGGDVAHFTEFATLINAEDIGFQAGVAEVVIECPRTETTPFFIRVEDLALDEALTGKEQYTVVLNGYDLVALDHADKIISFDLEVTDPTRQPDGALRFNVMGHLRVDCRSPECQLLPLRLEMEAVNAEAATAQAPQAPPQQPVEVHRDPPRGLQRRRFEKAVHWLKKQFVTLTDLDEVKQSVIGDDADSLRRRLFRIGPRRFFLKLLKWRITTPYLLRVYYLVISGDADTLHSEELPCVENKYQWDLTTEIHREEVGIVPVQYPVQPGFDAATLAFKRLSIDLTLDPQDGTTDPVQWGKGLHMLEWCTAIRDLRHDDGMISADLDLFYKAWSEGMNEVITWTTWGAFRAAGSARLGARLMLLQFKGASPPVQRAVPGVIGWPGGGLSARHDPRARAERAIADGVIADDVIADDVIREAAE